jgi:hypothetical protein
MFSLKLFVALSVVVSVMAEPPRRVKLNVPKQLQLPSQTARPFRSQAAPIRFPARQELAEPEPEPEGYSYPKPTDTYGPPEPETTQAAPTPSDSELDALRAIFAQQLKLKKPIKVQSIKLPEPIVYYEYPEFYHDDFHHHNHYEHYHHHF